MASIATDKHGQRRVEFVTLDGTRRPKIWLGKVSMRYAEAVQAGVDELLAAKRETRALSRHFSHWLADVKAHDPKLACKLAKAGLIEAPANVQSLTLSTF